MSGSWIATYRLQLHAGFPLSAAQRVLGYLAELGISHVYLSPCLQAVPGSQHGYDVVDPSKISDDLGGEPCLDRGLFVRDPGIRRAPGPRSGEHDQLEQPLVQLAVLAERKRNPVGRIGERRQTLQPACTHPDQRGKGMGMSLLADNLARVDSEGMAAYLESSNPDNDTRYERLGFVRAGEFQRPDGQLTCSTMWREPRRATSR